MISEHDAQTLPSSSATLQRRLMLVSMLILFLYAALIL
jgi:hypothetical protein